MPKYTDHDTFLDFEEEGHHTTFSDKGKHGSLKVKVHVIKDPLVSREGNNIVSKHFITLSEAL